MPFAYFTRLPRARQRIYLASDAVRQVPLPGPAACGPAIAALRTALADDHRAGVERASQAFANELVRQLEVPPVAIHVLAARPNRYGGELHGLYEPAPTPARITVWMRTAQRRQVVAFRTFLRTLLHELLHHLDYEWLHLAESFHTEGFYHRESHLLKQVLGE